MSAAPERRDGAGVAGTLMLVDAASLYFRAFYGVPDGRKEAGQSPNNAVRGFLDMLATLVTQHRPTGLVACWDDDWRPAFRVEAIPSYKAHRVAETGGEETPPELDVQVPVIIEALAAVGIARMGSPGYEADDVIGTLAARGVAGGRPVDVVTGDRDLFQLVDDAAHVRILYTAKGGVRDAAMIDQAALKSSYGVDSGDGYADLAVLRGDPSDGLPGVPGVGEKTAAELLTTYGSLEGVLKAIDDVDVRLKGARARKLADARGYLDVAPRVVRVARDAPLPALDGVPVTDVGALPREVADPRLLSALAVDHRLTSPFNRLLSALGLD